MKASVWLRVPSGSLSIPMYIINGGDQNYGWSAVQIFTVTTTWQQFTLVGTSQNGTYALALQLGGWGMLTGGQVLQVWGADLEVNDAGPTTNILPSSQQVFAASWDIADVTVGSSNDPAPDNTNTTSLVTANAGTTNGRVADFVANPAQYSSQTVTGSIYVRVPSGTATTSLFLGELGSQGQVDFASLPVTLTTTWQRFELTGQTQSALAYLWLQVGGGGTLPDGESIEVWGAQMRVGSSAGTYVATSNTTTNSGGGSYVLAPNGLNETYSYDSFGNMQQAGNFTFQQPYTPENRLFGYAYDAAGNLLTDRLTLNMTYDANERIASVNNTTYSYLPTGERVGKSGGSGPATDTIYFGGRPIARLSGGVYTDLIYGPNGLLAEVPTGGVPTYRMLDNLGTEVGTIDNTGNVLSVSDYAPFGQQFSGGDGDPYKFTGKERDTESGLDYFGARYFGSNMGRFMSPDWSDSPDTVPYAEFENPQTLNLYSYGRNSPLVYNDPDGHEVKVCDNNGQCNTVSNDAYTAAQQGNNGSLNAPTLNQVGINGNGSGQFNSTSITDGSGNSVGSATYVSNGGADYYANRNGINQLAQASATIGSVKGVGSFYVASALLGAGVAFSPIMGAGAGLTTLSLPSGLKAGAYIGAYVMSEHAAEQADRLGVTAAEIEEAVAGVAKGNPNPERAWDSVQRFYTATCEVRVNKVTGTIVTIVNKVRR